MMNDDSTMTADSMKTADSRKIADLSLQAGWMKTDGLKSKTD